MLYVCSIVQERRVTVDTMYILVSGYIRANIFKIRAISIHALGDLGVSSNLIGSLSLANEH